MTDWLALVIIQHDPRYSALAGLFAIGCGYALVRYRNAIGDLTGYYASHQYVNRKTPGCFLVPFGILFMAAGAIMFIVSLAEILWD